MVSSDALLTISAPQGFGAVSLPVAAGTTVRVRHCIPSTRALLSMHASGLCQ